mgnify:CR=1 FL=1
MISPIPTVTALKTREISTPLYTVVKPYPYLSTSGTIIMLAMTGGRGIYKLLLSKEVSAECAEQCSDTSEDDIPDDAACDKIGKFRHPMKRPGMAAGVKIRKDAKRFRKAYLNGA